MCSFQIKKHAGIDWGHKEGDIEALIFKACVTWKTHFGTLAA